MILYRALAERIREQNTIGIWRHLYSRDLDKWQFHLLGRDLTVLSHGLRWQGIMDCRRDFLDWSLSPLIALFFATSELPSEALSKDFAVYAYESNYFSPPPPINDPFAVSTPVVEVHADHYSDRMAAQRGFFTLHQQPDRPFREKTLVKITFPSAVRDTILFDLDFYGVNRAALFPGLDGIAAYWAWFYRISDT